jgi:hypothetical protein
MDPRSNFHDGMLHQVEALSSPPSPKAYPLDAVSFPFELNLWGRRGNAPGQHHRSRGTKPWEPRHLDSLSPKGKWIGRLKEFDQMPQRKGDKPQCDRRDEMSEGRHR